MLKFSAWLGVAFGLSLAVLEAARNWGDWEWWPFWVVDYVAASLLVAGGTVALRGGARHGLAAGWGFACAMFWMSFFGHLEGMMRTGGVSARERLLTTVIGLMFGLTILGLAAALAPMKNARR